MSLPLRICLGDLRSFTTQMLTVALLISLPSSATALTNMLGNLLTAGAEGPWVKLVVSVTRELSLTSSTWSIPIWVLALVSIYVINLHAVNELRSTLMTLRYLGALIKDLIKILILRLTLLSTLSWLVGWSLGLTASQIAFRISAYLVRAPYEVPVLNLGNLLQLAMLTYLTAFLGSLPVIIKLLGGELMR